MIVIGLDLGLNLGYGISNGTAIYRSGTWKNTAKSPGRRWRDLERGIRNIVNTSLEMDETSEVGDVRMFYEDVKRHAGTTAAHVYGGHLAILQSQCEMYGVQPVGLPVGRIKKFATGKGNASKQEMIDAAKNRWSGIPIIDDNHADALWITAYGCNILEQ